MRLAAIGLLATGWTFLFVLPIPAAVLIGTSVGILYQMWEDR